jgi:Uma2 family endonuclease
MATTAKLTLAEFLALPETEPASEFVDGEIVERGMPTRIHGIIQSRLARDVLDYLDASGLGGEAGSEIRCIFGPPGAEQARVPDFVFIRASRLPPDDASRNGPFYGPPDLAVEILAPDDRPTRVADKILFYLQNGVRMVWLIDPVERTVRVYTPTSMRTLAAGETLAGSDVLPGFRVAVEALFPPRPAA